MPILSSHTVRETFSTSMHRKATTVLSAAVASSLLAKGSSVRMTTSWSGLRQAVAKLSTPRNVLINASYLFASDSLDVDELCKFVLAWKQSERVKQLIFTYSNTVNEISGEKFTQFKKKLKAEFSTDGQVIQSIIYRKKRNSNSVDSSKFVRQKLVFKGDV
jgi:hypothetical protein